MSSVATTEDGDPPSVVRYLRKKNLEDPWNPPSRVGVAAKDEGADQTDVFAPSRWFRGKALDSPESFRKHRRIGALR
jgi:hypothetical protein